MKTVPNIISTKDLSYIEDMLNWKFILIKKMNNYMNDIQDESIKKVIQSASEELTKEYEKYVDYLN